MVTLSVCGMFKEVLTVLAGTIVFGDHLAVSNIWGVLVTLGGIAWYNWIKIQRMKEEDEEEKELGSPGYEMVDREVGAHPQEIFSNPIISKGKLMINSCCLVTNPVDPPKPYSKSERTVLLSSSRIGGSNDRLT